MFGILLPTRGREKFLRKNLESLIESVWELKVNEKANIKLELVIVVDDDEFSLKVISEFDDQFTVFSRVKVFDSQERLYSVKAYNKAFELSESEIFCWVSNLIVFHNIKWISKAIRFFNTFFPDSMGAMSLRKNSGAAFGITSRKFIEFSGREFFYPGYRIHYPDQELTFKAMLLGRYAWPEEDLVFHRKEGKSKEEIIDPVKRAVMISGDKAVYSERRKSFFDLPPWKIRNKGVDFEKFQKIIIYDQEF